MIKPNLKAVKKHFANTKTIRCLANTMDIDVTGTTDFEYDATLERWTSIGGAVVFCEGGFYAEIINTVSKKKCKCENCDCNKVKTVKRNFKK